MRVLITGGAGLIGRALAANLIGDGHDVVVLSRDPQTAAGLIINLAGENIAAGRWTPQRKRRIRDSRLSAGRAVVQAVEAAARRPGVVIQASGVGFYGNCSDDEEVTEETPPGDDFLAQLAIEWEGSTSCVRELGVRWVAIRTGVVLSTEGGAMARMMLPVRLLSAGRFGSGRQWFPWIHIADEVDAIRFLIENEAASGPFNLVATNPVTNAEFARNLGRELGRSLLVPVPALALRILLGEMATALLGGQRAVPRRLLQMGFTFRFQDVGTALRDLLR